MKVLSHLRIKQDFDSDYYYEEQQFVKTRDSFYDIFFYLELKSLTGAQRLQPKCVLLCLVTLNGRCTQFIGRFCYCVVSLSLIHIFYKIHLGKAITPFLF